MRKVHVYLLLKLPAAFFCGVRVDHISAQCVRTRLRLRWINQNPFRSLFWAVQGMAAELASGLLVINEINKNQVSMSMLLVGVQGRFTKKARGQVHFTCEQGQKVQEHVKKAIFSGEGEVFDLIAIGRDAHGDQVAEFCFNWSVKLRAASRV